MHSYFSDALMSPCSSVHSIEATSLFDFGPFLIVIVPSKENKIIDWFSILFPNWSSFSMETNAIHCMNIVSCKLCNCVNFR